MSLNFCHVYFREISFCVGLNLDLKIIKLHKCRDLWWLSDLCFWPENFAYRVENWQQESKRLIKTSFRTHEWSHNFFFKSYSDSDYTSSIKPISRLLISWVMPQMNNRKIWNSNFSFSHNLDITSWPYNECWLFVPE